MLGSHDLHSNEWHSILIAPNDRDLELAVIDAQGLHALVFPCRRGIRGWVRTEDNHPVEIYPTHWREWRSAPSFVV
jgi:hypothetical protein